MKAWLASDLSELDLLVIQIDGLHVGDHVLMAAIGVDGNGDKHVLAVVEGATENTVWSFHKTNIACGFSSKPGVKARGVPVLSTATGVEPVVSTAKPLTAAAALPPAFFKTIFYSDLQPLDVIKRVLSELVFGGITVEVLLPARVVKY